MDWYLIMVALGLPQISALYVDAVKRRPRPSWLAGLLRIDNGLKRLFASRAFRWQPAWPMAGVIVLFLVTLIVPGAAPCRSQFARLARRGLGLHRTHGPGGQFLRPARLRRHRLAAQGPRPHLHGYAWFLFSADARRRQPLCARPRAPMAATPHCRLLDDYPTDYFLLETWGMRGALFGKHSSRTSPSPFIATPRRCF